MFSRQTRGECSTNTASQDGSPKLYVTYVPIWDNWHAVYASLKVFTHVLSSIKIFVDHLMSYRTISSPFYPVHKRYLFVYFISEVEWHLKTGHPSSQTEPANYRSLTYVLVVLYVRWLWTMRCIWSTALRSTQENTQEGTWKQESAIEATLC